MNRALSRLMSAFLLSSLMGCTRHIGHLTLASEKYFVPADYDLSKAEKTFSTGKSDQLVFYIWDVEPLASIREAINDAVKKVDGDFMRDIEITESKFGVVLFGKKTITVEGVVYKLPKKGVQLNFD